MRLTSLPLGSTESRPFARRLKGVESIEFTRCIFVLDATGLIPPVRYDRFRYEVRNLNCLDGPGWGFVDSTLRGA